MDSHFIFIVQGVLVTLKFTTLSLLCGLPLGTLLAGAKVSSCVWLRRVAYGYTSVFRGTPLLVQLGLFYYGLPQLTGYAISTFEAGVLTFALNSAAYTSEIMRAGIEAVDEGQWQAGQVLGLTNKQIFIHIILPQAFRNMLPALMNEVIDLLKESSLIATLGEMDILRRAQVVAGQTYLYFEPLCMAALCYFVMVMMLSRFVKYIERRYV